jgi:hypothetical protein
MENLTINQTGFYFLVKTKVQDYKGYETEMLSMFPKDIWPDEACIGIRQGLVCQENVRSCDIEVYVLKSNSQTLFTKYKRYYFDEVRKQHLENLLRKVS